MRCGHPDNDPCWCYLWQLAEAVRRNGNEWCAFVVTK